MIDIYVINLKNRTDRLKKFKENFDKHFNINVIEAVKNKEGWKGCLQSHLREPSTSEVKQAECILTGKFLRCLIVPE